LPVASEVFEEKGEISSWAAKQAAEKLCLMTEWLKPLLILRHLRRGWKPRAFKTQPQAEFFSSL
jgi:hypothetical protein